MQFDSNRVAVAFAILLLCVICQTSAQAQATEAVEDAPLPVDGLSQEFVVSLGPGVLVLPQTTGRTRPFYGLDASFGWYFHPNVGVSFSYGVRWDIEGPDGTNTLRFSQRPSVALTARHQLTRPLLIFGELGLGLIHEFIRHQAPFGGSQARDKFGPFAFLSAGVMLTTGLVGVRTSIDVVAERSGIGVGGSARVLFSF